MHISGTLMSKDTEIATVSNGRITPIRQELMPFYLQKRDDFEGWLGERAIDAHRTHSRLLKKALRLTSATDPEIVLRVHAATITDTYWFRDAGRTLTYADVKFKKNIFDKLALDGDLESLNLQPEPTPELTNIGSFEKAWRLIDGRWWIYKQGTLKEKFSELFTYRLGKSLGFPMAEYELAGSYVRSPDFTNGAAVNFDSAWGLVLDDEDYTKSYRAIRGLSKQAASHYVAMLALDTVVRNGDRHTRNYGLLRDPDTGRVIDLAPNFDNNVALISAQEYPPVKPSPNDLLIKLFIQFLQENPDAESDYLANWHINISNDAVLEIVNDIGMNVRRQFVADFITNRIGLLNQKLELELQQSTMMDMTLG